MSEQNQPSRCCCELVEEYKSIPLAPWNTFDAADSVIKQKVLSRNTKPVFSRTATRFGYRTLEDKYSFQHHDDIREYMTEYRNMFAVNNRLTNRATTHRAPPQYRMAHTHHLHTR